MLETPVVAWRQLLQGKLRVMAEKRRVFKPEFREGAVGIVLETGKPFPGVAQDLGIDETCWRAGSRGLGRGASSARWSPRST